MRLTIEPLQSPHVRLEPLRISDAEGLAPVLADPALYRFTGGEPPDLAQLRSRFARQTAGASPDGRAIWLNWVIRTARAGEAGEADDADTVVGTVQATVTEDADGPVAELAWVIGTAHQGRGLAQAAARLVAEWLNGHGVARLRAHIHPEHRASEAVAASLGLSLTGNLSDGERRWQRPADQA